MKNMNKLDLTGQRFGRLLAVTEVGRNESGSVMWKCACDCGKIIKVSASGLRTKTKSCGCLRVEKATIHGGSYLPEYKVWSDMFQRCVNPKEPSYKNYGARGIRVCESWLNFENFFGDMGKRTTPQHTIERKDNNGNYEPTNCRWATRHEQAINRRLQNNNLSGLPGIGFNKKTKKYNAIITVHRRGIWLGSFGLLDDAIQARKQAEQIYWEKGRESK